MVLLMCHTHYTLTQPETLGLIYNTLLNKKLKTNVMYSQCNIQWQTDETRRTSTDINTVMHVAVNMEKGQSMVKY